MRLLFVVNPNAGRFRTEPVTVITGYLARTDHEFIFFDWKRSHTREDLKRLIVGFAPDRVIAVGGDGTINYVASCLLYSPISLGILPTGSANGLANELLIPGFGPEALTLAITGNPRTIHVTKINETICLHLSDIGLNAQMMKSFNSGTHRGKSGYLMAAWQVFRHRRKIHISIRSADEEATHDAFIIIIANATKYATGAVINPEGKINDGIFELIVFDQLSFWEIVKMLFTHLALNPRIIRVYHGPAFIIASQEKVHLQVDGEYLGKVSTVDARLLPGALKIVVPEGPIVCF